MHPCITALCGCLYASLHNDFVRPLSCILCTFMNALLVSHPCETLGVHFIRHPCLTRKLRVLPPAAPKIIPRLLSGRKCSGVVESCLLFWFRILAKLWASTITHPCVCGRLGCHICASTAICAVASCNGSVWLSLCVLAPTLCDRYRASFARL